MPQKSSEIRVIIKLHTAINNVNEQKKQLHMAINNVNEQKKHYGSCPNSK